MKAIAKTAPGIRRALQALALAAMAGSALADAEATGALSQATTIKISRIRIVGNTVFDDAMLRPILAPFEGRTLGAADLEDLRLRLTRLYVDAGYINSGALIREQSVAGDVLTVSVIEGHLGEVKISGEHHYRPGYLQYLLVPDARPLNVNQLQERMQLLLQDGVIERVNAELAPGEHPGEAILRAAVREGPRFRVDLAVADDRPPSVGEIGGSIGFSARNLLGVNDATAVSAGFSSGYQGYAFQETLPLPESPSSLFVKLDKSHGAIVESSIRDLGITSRESSEEFGISVELLRTLREHAAVGFSFYHNETTTYLLGEPFSFTAGVVDGSSKVSALREALEWTYRAPEQVFAAKLVLDMGIGGLGATIHSGGALPDSHFVVWNGQAQYVRQVWQRAGEFVIKANLQLSSKGLLPSEKFAVGGAETVRGYPVNTLVRDRGAVASVEYRHTFAHLRLPAVSRNAGDGALALAAFYDAGTASDSGADATWLSGAGGGLRWTPSANCTAQVYKGFALHRLEPRGNSLQDRGIHFRFAYALSF